MRVPDRLRVLVSKKLLDLAEALPRFRKGALARLQLTREHQRKSAQRTYERTRPPEGTELKLLYFRLIEVFHIEHRNRLRKRMLRAFPELQKRPRSGGQNFLDWFDNRSGRLGSISSWRLGHIVHKDRRLHLDRARWERGNLPVEIDFIVVWLHAILPSLFALSFDVHLNDSVTRQLNSLQDRHYLPEARIHGLAPLGILYLGFSQIPPARVMRRELLAWLDRLRAKSEESLRPLTDGFFAGLSSGQVAKLPAIETYVLAGAPDRIEPLGSWIRNHIHWWDSLGFRHFEREIYTDGKVMFIPSSSRESEPQVANRLVVLREPYRRSMELSESGYEDQQVAYWTRLATLDALLPFIAVEEVLASSQGSIEQLRFRLFRSLKTGWPPDVSLWQHIGLGKRILRSSMQLSRISTEFEQNK
ncbi:MAG: hypothetical protein U9R72_01085, partial [Chloroflexota bacterium]|nr:hypothetical protein [Chloroflexota bacterium]